MKILTSFWFILVAYCNIVVGQDIHFSQFWDAMQYQNPALIGNFDGNIRISALYRNQWNQFGTPLQTSYFDAQFKSVFENQDYLSFGIYGLQDKYDRLFYRQYRIMGAMAFNKYLSEKFNLSAGIQIGAKLTSIDYDRLLFDRQWDPRTGNFEPSKPSYENFENINTYRMILNTGICANFYTGKALHSLDIGIGYINRPKDIYTSSIQNIPLKYTLNVHSYLVLTEKFTLMPKASLLYTSASNSFFTGSLLKYELNPFVQIYSGLMYRWGVDRNSDAISPTFGVVLNNLKIGASIDIATSGINQESQKAAFEGSIIYIFKTPKLKHFSVDCLRL